MWAVGNDRQVQISEGSQRTQRPQHDRGASLVEFALILPILMLILFGAITGGITLSRHNAVQNAAREASRFGATAPIGTTPAELSTWLNNVATEVEAAATGDLADGTQGKSICVAYVEGGTATRLNVDQSGTRTESVGRCLTPAQDPRAEARVQIVARRQSEIDTIFRSFVVNIEAKSVSRYERAP